MDLVVEIRKRFPLTVGIVASSEYEAALTAAGELWKATGELRAFNEQLESKCKFATCLMRNLAFGICDKYPDHLAKDLECDFAKLFQHLDKDTLRKVYNDKLTTVDDNAFEDAIYEIATAACCAGFFDKGSLELEKPFSASATPKNTDIAGKRNGLQWRVEVTLVHETIPTFDGETEEGNARTRAMMDRHDWDDLKDVNDGRATTFSDAARSDENYNPNPLSTSIWQALDKKRRQCEKGVHNIIVLGLPLPVSDRAAEAAVRGAEYLEINLEEATFARTKSAPFIPRANASNPETNVDPFMIVSGVWLLRLNRNYARSTIIENPNAAKSMSGADRQVLESIGLVRAQRKVD